MTNNTEPKNTLMSAFDTVYNISIDSEMDAATLAPAGKEFKLLHDRLNLSQFQAVFVAHVIDSEKDLALTYLSRALHTSRIRMLRFNSEIEELISRGWIGKYIRPFDDCTARYFVKKRVLDKWMVDEIYEAPEIENLSLEDFIHELGTIFDDRDKDLLEYDAMQSQILELMEKNPKLELCSFVRDMPDMDKVLFMFFVSSYTNLDEETLCDRDFNELFKRNMRARMYINSVRRMACPLFTQGLIKEALPDMMGSHGAFCLSDRVLKYLKYGLGIQETVIEANPDSRKGLVLHEDISCKKLFYNADEDALISKLTRILRKTRFQKLQRSLTANGMRRGFACLFYGGPGTGKTETVLQLARATGRDIMKVDLASIRSKWVGDSEKNVKAIFDHYRYYCENCEKTPILLLNEADGLIASRNMSPEHSVDQMMNTMQNIILEEIEKLDGILIATTNLAGNLDKAFERRFLYKIQFHKPMADVQGKIWHTMIPKLSKNDISELVSMYDFSGGQIENIARKVIIDSILEDKKLTLADLQANCDNEKLPSKKLKQTHKPVGFIRA